MSDINWDKDNLIMTGASNKNNTSYSFETFQNAIGNFQNDDTVFVIPTVNKPIKIVFEEFPIYKYLEDQIKTVRSDIYSAIPYAFNDVDREYFAIYSDNDLPELNEEEFFKILEAE